MEDALGNSGGRDRAVGALGPAAGAWDRFRAAADRVLSPADELGPSDHSRRRRLLLAMSSTLAATLTLATVVSTATTVAFPDPSVSLGWRGTGVVGVAAVGFWAGYALNRRGRYRIGAWATIATIYVFVIAFGLFYPPTRIGLVGAFVVPVLMATITLDGNGTMAVLAISTVVSSAALVGAEATVVTKCASIGALVVAGVLTAIVAQLRQRDLQQVQRLADLQRADGERIRHELALARTVQAAMLPTELPRVVPYEIAAFSEAASEASGDFYDVFELDHLPALPGVAGGRRRGLAIAVGDVAGKGLAAALVMAATRAAVRAEAGQTASPARVVSRVNQLLVRSVPAGLFVTMVFAIADPDRGELRFASGGHPHPLQWQQGERRLAEIESFGLPLGLDADAVYEESVVSLGPDDFVVFYTDGLVEAQNRAAEMYGFERAQHDVARAAGIGVGRRAAERASRRVEFLVAELRGFSEDAPAVDDTTLVVLEVDGQAAAVAASPAGTSARP